MQRQKFVVNAQQRQQQQRQHQEPAPEPALQEQEHARQLEAELHETAGLEYELTKDAQLSAEQVRELPVHEYRMKFEECLFKTTAEWGYKRPPEPSPFLQMRAVKLLAQAFEAEAGADPAALQALHSLQQAIQGQIQPANEYLMELEKSLAAPSTLKRLLDRAKGVDKRLDEAQVTMEMPAVSQALQEKMQEVELFLAGDWEQKQRGVVAIHVDDATQTTILQIGVAPYGCVYITIPALLSPEDIALLSLRTMFGRLAPFVNIVDPMAVINGQHQRLNYNEIFRKTRVMRAPSGNTSRLTQNIAVTSKRERLSAENTVILNATPASLEEYTRVFPQDLERNHWGAWDGVAQRWTGAATAQKFEAAQQVSREAMLKALTEEQNVIVVVAHCDGESIFLPQPPPGGSLVTPDYLLAHKDEIAANAPFVYLFSCEAGDQRGLRNFASTLLECGASGVIASQSTIGSAEGRQLLSRVLDEKRGAPPIADYYNAMNEVNYRDMEVFLG